MYLFLDTRVLCNKIRARYRPDYSTLKESTLKIRYFLNNGSKCLIVTSNTVFYTKLNYMSRQLTTATMTLWPHKVIPTTIMKR